jgi:hypothetical protein
MLLMWAIGLNLQTGKIVFKAATGHLAPLDRYFGEFVYRYFGKVFSVLRQEA